MLSTVLFFLGLVLLIFGVIALLMMLFEGPDRVNHETAWKFLTTDISLSLLSFIGSVVGHHIGW